MSEETQPGTSPLDAERQRLRAEGYKDDEISRILVTRALGGNTGPTGAPAHPQGIFSNVLSSILAVTGYVGGLFTSVRQDVATILDRSAPARVRTGAFVSIAVKAIIVGVLAYAGLQEWQQHINSATEIAAAQAKKLQIEADNAKALNEAQVKKLEAEAAVAKQINDAQAQKLRADADAAKALNDAQVKKLEAEAAVAGQVNQAQATKTGEDAKVAAEVAAGQAAQARKTEAEAKYAEELAEGQKAQACTARMDMIVKTLPMSKWGAAMEDYNRDCDPAYAAQAKACDEKFGSVINAIETTVFDNNFSSNVKIVIDKYKQECRITPEQEKLSKATLERKFATTRFGGPSDSTKSTSTPSASVPPPSPQTASLPPADGGDASDEEISAAYARHDYNSAYKLALRHTYALEARHEPGGEYSPWLSVADNALLSGHYQASLEAAERSMQFVHGGDLPSKLRMGRALMMLDRIDEARPFFQQAINDPNRGISAKGIGIVFADMRSAGISHPMMAEIERMAKK